MNQVVVLASTSPYRAELLNRLKLDFKRDAPHVNEAHRSGESSACRATRLAQEKACALSHKYPNGLILGSDQVACCEGQVLDKPGTEARAIAQLLKMRGKVVEFHTALCVYATQTKQQRSHVDLTTATLRSDLSDDAIARYVHIDNPLDCAGSFKVESLGISLFESVKSDDPTALIGLPLIGVTQILNEFGVQLP